MQRPRNPLLTLLFIVALVLPWLVFLFLPAEIVPGARFILDGDNLFPAADLAGRGCAKARDSGWSRLWPTHVERGGATSSRPRYTSAE
jgi:hypothetical protein